MKWPKVGIAQMAVNRGDWGHRRWRRWRRWAWIGVVAAVAVFVLSWAIKDRLFTVKQVVVVQQVRIEPDVVPLDQVQSFANRQIGTWLWLERSGLEQNILNRYPSVRQVDTDVHFPDTLEINVLPRVPLCQLVTPSGAYVVDREGFVFARLQSINSKLPQIKTNRQPSIGSTVSSQGLILGLRLITGLRASQPPLQEIDLHDQQLDIHLGGPPLIMVSEDAQAGTILEQIKALMGKFNSDHHFPQQLDMRFERPVLRY